MRRQDDLAIVGHGMVSSLGHDVVTSCATARSGVTRPSGFNEFLVADSREVVPDALTVHAVDTLTYGFSGKARLLRLIEAGLRDLLKQCPGKPWLEARTTFYISLPSWVRPHTGAPLIADEERRSEFEAQASEAERGDDLALAQKLVLQAADLSEWGNPPEVSYVFVSGTTGTAEAVDLASKDLQSGSTEMAVVLAVDSWIDVTLANWLKETGRLKTPDLPVGLQLGEACVVLLLEQGRRTQHRGATILGNLMQVVFSQDERFLLSGQVPIGRSLARVLNSAYNNANWSDGSPWIICDHNGETYRATEWANTLYHLSKLSDVYKNNNIWFPALAFGDTGSASGAVALCMALRAFARGYAPHPIAVIANSSDGPLRSAMVVRQP